ncbi:MAG: hypothetical protein ACLFU7_11995 [Armatimonadota bacterium]
MLPTGSSTEARRPPSHQRTFPHGRARAVLTPPLSALLAVVLLAPGGCDRSPPVDRWPMASAITAGGESFVAWALPPDRFGLGLTSHVVEVKDYVTAICPLHERGAMIFTPSGGFDVRAEKDLWSTQPDVRNAAALGATRLALILGGDTTACAPGEPAEPPPWLMGAEIRIGRIDDNQLRVGPSELPHTVNPWRIQHGRFGGEDDALLVLVYTRAPFDDVMRRRPWIYRITEGDDGLPHLDPRWRGTSFAHPFRDATFGDFTGRGEGEIAALEVTEDGGRMITAYHFEGFGLEGLAPSARVPPVEDRLHAARWNASEADGLVVRALDGRFIFYELDAEKGELRQRSAVDGPGSVLGWIVTGAETAGPGELICVLPGGDLWRANLAD